MALKQLRLAVVNASGVQTDRLDLTVLGQPPGRLRRKPGEVELGDAFTATLLGAQVFHPIVPMLIPASLEKNDRPCGDSAVLRFPSLEIGDADLIVAVRLRFRRYVHRDCRTDQPGKRDLIDGLASLR